MYTIITSFIGDVLPGITRYMLPLQYVASFVVTLVVTVSANLLAVQMVKKHRMANSELAETLDLCSKAMKTAFLFFFSTTCIQVKV